MYVILVYDIKTDNGGQKVLNRTFKICKKYLCHIQNSVFEGIDSVILFKSRNERWLNKEMWGKNEDKTSNFI